MQVKEVGEFLEDIDEFEIADMSAIESDEINDIVAIEIELEKPISGEREIIKINCYPRKENINDHLGLRPAGGSPFEYKPKKWYELIYNMSEQEASKEAVGFVSRQIHKNNINFRDILGKGYELEIGW